MLIFLWKKKEAYSGETRMHMNLLDAEWKWKNKKIRNQSILDIFFYWDPIFFDMVPIYSKK